MATKMTCFELIKSKVNPPVVFNHVDEVLWFAGPDPMSAAKKAFALIVRAAGNPGDATYSFCIQNPETGQVFEFQGCRVKNDDPERFGGLYRPAYTNSAARITF